MAKIFVAFLGTNNYSHCKYQIDKWISEPVRYVQEALVQYYCKDWGKEDRFLIFATEGENGSIEKNWTNGSINNNDKYAKEIEPVGSGLKKRLEKLQLNCSIEMISIPDGTQDGEIWEIIRKISENIPKKSELFFDITHSFRYIPMIVPSIISFLKTTKEINLTSIHYGAFEVLGTYWEVSNMEVDKRVAPVRELTELYGMIEWSEAVDAFLKYGNTNSLVKQIKSLKDVSSELKEKLTTTELNIEKLGKTLRFNNVKELDKIEKKVEISKEIDIDKLPSFFPLKEISSQIEDHLSIWSDNEIKNGFLASKWCLDNDRFAQALTFAQESSISHFYKLFSWGEYDKNIKEWKKKGCVDFTIQIKLEDKRINEFQGKYPIKDWFKRNINNALNQLDRNDPLLKDFINLRIWRNIISHTGKGDREYMEKNFPDVLKRFLEQY